MNTSQEEMKVFEKMPRDSEYGVAVRWSQKEANGAWSTFVRSSLAGEIPNDFGKGVTPTTLDE